MITFRIPTAFATLLLVAGYVFAAPAVRTVQVGAVMNESGSDGLLAQMHCQDAFGNTQATWNGGLWGGDREGWHHNTKAYDVHSGAYYMYQRWYSPETGTFMSNAPFEPMTEHPYGFANYSPAAYIDPSGEIWIAVPIAGALLNCGLGILNVNALLKCLESCERAVKAREAYEKSAGDKADQDWIAKLKCEEAQCPSDCLNAVGGSISQQALLCAASVIGVRKFPKPVK